MAQRPTVRARSAQDWLAYLEQRAPEAFPAVLAEIPETSRELILSAAKTEWIDVAHDRFVPHATIEVLGLDEATRLWAEFIGSHLEAPLFRGLVDAMIRLFGLSPSTFVRLTPRAWKQSFRDCCEINVQETEERHARLAFSEVHEEIITWRAYPQSWRAVLSGVFNLTKIEGELDMKVDVEARRIDMHWHW